MSHWSLAYNFRTRLTVEKDEKGREIFPLPEIITDIVGAKEGDEFLCVVTADGGIMLRKLVD
jgi:hypothetical protein